MFSCVFRFLRCFHVFFFRCFRVPLSFLGVFGPVGSRNIVFCCIFGTAASRTIGNHRFLRCCREPRPRTIVSSYVLWFSRCFQICPVFSGSFWLWEGRHPTHDAYDKALDLSADGAESGLLADGHFGVIWGICSDLESRHDELGLTSYTSGKPCFLCDCDADGCHWNVLRPSANWTNTVWTARRWRARMTHTHRFLFLYQALI